MLSSAIVLGPQRRDPTVCDAINDLVSDRKQSVAVVTAGWEEREEEDEELCQHVGRPVENLRIWARVERLFEQDKELLAAMRERQATLHRVQDLYRLRLEGLMQSTRELLRRAEDDPLVAAEEWDSWVLVRGLDDQHMARVAQIHAEFYERVKPDEREGVQREREAISKQLGQVACLLVAGGHIGVLLHRLQLVDLFGSWGDRPVIAWSAGAMALSDRIVLFHDDPPQGSSFAEVMESGLGLLPGFVALPHASQRLHTDDTVRVRMLSRRFSPAICGLLDHCARFDWQGGQWTPQKGARQLGEDGLIEEAAV